MPGASQSPQQSDRSCSDLRKEFEARIRNVIRTALALILTLSACAHEAGPSKTATSTDSIHLMPSTWQGDWGLYQILWSRNYGKVLDKQIAKFATKPKYVMFYRDLGRPFPARQIKDVRARGADPIISLELWRWMHGRSRQTSYLPAINNGDWDDFFRAWGEGAKKEGGRVMLRFGFEMNGDWFTWSGDPAAYKKAWQRARRIIRDEAGAKNVEWVWAPNCQSAPNTPENDMHHYYPGDDVVDWVGIDGYNFGEHHDKWHTWQSFENVFDVLLTEFEKRYAGKPIMIAETGSAPGKDGQRVQWIHDAFDYLAKRPRVQALIWFNLDKRRENEPDWRIDVTPESLAAFNATFASSR